MSDGEWAQPVKTPGSWKPPLPLAKWLEKHANSPSVQILSKAAGGVAIAAVIGAALAAFIMVMLAACAAAAAVIGLAIGFALAIFSGLNLASQNQPDFLKWFNGKAASIGPPEAPDCFNQGANMLDPDFIICKTQSIGSDAGVAFWNGYLAPSPLVRIIAATIVSTDLVTIVAHVPKSILEK